MQIIPTLHFNGQAAEAIALYEQAFRTKAGFILRYTDRNEADWSDPIPPGQENYVYHAEMHIGGHRFMFGDNSVPDDSRTQNSFLTVVFDTAEEVHAAYEVMKDGCTIIYPMHSTTYSACAVSLLDKFGFRWGLMTEQTSDM